MVALKLRIEVHLERAVFFDVTPRPEEIDVPLGTAAKLFWCRVVQTLNEDETKAIFLALFVLVEGNLHLAGEEGPRDLKNERFHIGQRQRDLMSRPRRIHAVRRYNHI